jgi:transcriptional regulator with XRE-family HTH domain
MYGKSILNQRGDLLKQCRARVRPESASLGPYPRLPVRVGKSPTQEEVAEAVGVSRQWYATMESARGVRTSARTLGRVADALSMSPAERADLFRLAVPELAPFAPAPRSIATLDAFASLRRLTRTLWAATTEAEALTIVREYAMFQLGLDSAVSCVRVGEGGWTFAGTGRAYGEQRMRRYQELNGERWGPAALDDLYCYTLMVYPGEVMTRTERDARFPDLAARERATLEAVDLADVSAVMAAVRSHHGFVARLLAVHYRQHIFSATERAQLSTLADIASLALSGRG